MMSGSLRAPPPLQAKKKSSISSSSSLFLFLSISSIFIFLYFFSTSSPSLSSTKSVFSYRNPPEFCNFTNGKWVLEPNPKILYDHTCKEIFKGWNCIANNKSNGRDLLHWRWQPSGCDLPRFDPKSFLERFRNTNIGFVGDSLNRNMFVSMVCSLRRVSSGVRKWRPAKADRGFTFLPYNVTVAYHRTNLLAHYDRWYASGSGGDLESLGYKQGFRVDVDIPDGSWALAPSFHDILIFNTGHWWWAPSKFDPVNSPMLFFANGHPLIPPLQPEDGLNMTLKHMISFVETEAKRNAVKFFRTQSPRHFEGGDWNDGGFCQHVRPLDQHQVDQLFLMDKKKTNMEARLANMHMLRAIKGSSFHVLDVTRMSEFRGDAHPSSSGGKRHDDCMHWCLPGLTDFWNDMLVAHLSRT